MTNMHKESGLKTADFERFLINNADLDRLRAHLMRFNPIKTMGMEEMEIRHSAILAWLMNPQESHGLGDNFLKSFLAEALHDAEKQDATLSALDVVRADMMDAEINREWRHIDILVVSRKNNWVFVIENKFNSRQHSKQLQRYMETVEKEFDKESMKITGIFLTLNEEEPEDKRYVPITYENIYRLLENHIMVGHYQLKPEVKIFLNHYLRVIGEKTGMSGEHKNMIDLARKIYAENKRAIDFIVEHGKRTDLTVACEQVFNLQGTEDDKRGFVEVEGTEFRFGGINGPHPYFLPRSWDEALENFDREGCKGWWLGLPLIMFLSLTPDNEGASGNLRLIAEVGPLENHEWRLQIIEAIKKEAAHDRDSKISFRKDAYNEGNRYARFFMPQKSTRTVSDIHDSEEISGAIKKLLKDFSGEIKAVGHALEKIRDSNANTDGN